MKRVLFTNALFLSKWKNFGMNSDGTGKTFRPFIQERLMACRMFQGQSCWRTAGFCTTGAKLRGYSAVNRFANEYGSCFEYNALAPMGFHDVSLRKW